MDTSDERLERLEGSGMGQLGSPGIAMGVFDSPLHDQFCYTCNRHVKGPFVLDNLGFSTCSRCLTHRQSTGSASSQRAIGDANHDEQCSGIETGPVRLEFDEVLPSSAVFSEQPSNGGPIISKSLSSYTHTSIEAVNATRKRQLEDSEKDALFIERTLENLKERRYSAGNNIGKPLRKCTRCGYYDTEFPDAESGLDLQVCVKCHRHSEKKREYRLRNRKTRKNQEEEKQNSDEVAASCDTSAVWSVTDMMPVRCIRCKGDEHPVVERRPGKMVCLKCCNQLDKRREKSRRYREKVKARMGAAVRPYSRAEKESLSDSNCDWDISFSDLDSL